MTPADQRNMEVGLREYIETLFAERDRYYELRARSAEDALSTAKLELERRLEALNELRAAVIADRNQFVKLDTYNVKTEYYDSWCRNVDEAISSMRASARTWTTALGIFFLIVQLFLHYLLKMGL